MISSWVGVPPVSSLTGVPSTPSPPSRGLPSPRPRLKPGFPCRKLLILDSKLGGETQAAGAEGGGGGGGGGLHSLSFSQSLVRPVSRFRLFPSVGLVGGAFAEEDSGEEREGGAAEEEVGFPVTL